MAGECISYGAFGAYSTAYNRFKDSRPSYNRTELHASINPSGNNRYLPNVTGEKSSADSYDHEFHAGLRDFNPEVTWVTQRYTPLDERTFAPVPRHKYLVKRSGVPPPAQWIPPHPDDDIELKKFSRMREEESAYRSIPSSRDERWSTLREMLPSRGYTVRPYPPNWGSKASMAPGRVVEPPKRFPVIDSPMSRFVSDMLLTNREFRLY